MPFQSKGVTAIKGIISTFNMITLLLPDMIMDFNIIFVKL